METPKDVLIIISDQVKTGKVNLEARFVCLGLLKDLLYLLNSGQIDK